jgi:hypothetical protein
MVATDGCLRCTASYGETKLRSWTWVADTGFALDAGTTQAVGRAQSQAGSGK